MTTALTPIKASPTPQTASVLSLTESVTNTSLSIDLQGIEQASIQSIYTDATPGAKTFVAANVNTTNDTITITAHGFVTGLKIALTGTNLPGGLSATNYWTIVVDANTISVATSLVNAVAGTKVDITSQGTTADAAFTPTSLGSSTFALYESNDGTNFIAISGATVTISAAGTSIFHIANPSFRYLQLLFTAPVAGALTISAIMNIRKTNVQS